MYALEVKNLNFRYKQQLVLDDLEFKISKGEIYGLVGKPKSGKTTVLKLILGLLRMSSASILIDGLDFSKKREQIQNITGNIIDLPYYQGFLTVWENLKYWDVQFKYGDERISEVLKLVGLTGNKNKKVKSLTSLQQKKLSIGIALYHNPTFLIFDDLFRGLDEKEQKDLCRLLTKIKKENKTILFSNRDFDSVSSICSRIGLLENGRIEFEGDSKECKKYLKANLNAMTV